jgi:YggT family protein
MFTQALLFLLNTLLGLFTIAVLLRFYLQLTGAPFYNPLSQAVITITNFMVRPLRRFVPSWRSLDLSTLLLAFIAQLLLRLAQLWADNYPLTVAGFSVYIAICGLALVAMFKLSIYIFVYAVVIQAIMSWVNPHAAGADSLDSLTAPLLNPLRRMIGNTGGLDFSPLIAFIIGQLMFMLITRPLENFLSALL